MSVILFAFISQTPVFFQCQITVNIPAHQIVDEVSIFAVGKDWEFDEGFAKLTGVRMVSSGLVDDELWLKGDVSGSPKAHFESTVSMPKPGDDRYLLDWRITELRNNTKRRTLEMSGIGVCKQVLPTIAEAGPS
jgi:hypothetical protein